MVRINQTGTGNALVVEDETNPDATPFIVTSIGRVGIGTTNPSTALGVIGTLTIGIAGNNVSISSTELFRPNSSFTMRGGGSQSERNSITLTNDSGIIIDGGSTETYGVELKGGGGPVKVTQGTFLVGTSATTGTASQPLQVTGGAYVSGSVGIGTTNPSQSLHVQGNVRITGGLYDSNNNVGTAGSVLSSTGSGISWIAAASGGGIAISTNTTNQNQFLTYATGTGSTTGLGVTTTGLVFNPSSGNLGIGTTNPTSKLYVVGNAYITGVTTSTDFDSLSDVNLKTNINQIADPLEKVMQIRGVTFNWKEGNRNSAGVIAQEIEKVLPELVHGGETKTVNYNGLIGLLIECVKKQQEEIDELKRKVN
jgi:hypothetical protein